MKRCAEERDFTRRLIKKDTWYIHGAPDSAVTYLLIGEEKALVIDPGQNRNNIREYIEGITKLPLIVANTHGHFDHTASNGDFADCPIYISEHDAAVCKKYFPRVNPADYCFDYTPTPIKEGFVIDLGGRQIEAIAAGCHSAGSLLYLDSTYRLLFTGDEIECGQVLIQGYNREDGCVEKYRNNLLKINRRRAEFDMVCPAHNGAPADAELVDILIENCDRILSGIEGKPDISSPTYLGPEDPREPETKKKLIEDPMTRRSEWKGSSIIYSVDRIRYSDIPSKKRSDGNKT
jgi:hydroxyacylglutathione hydrolase